MAGDVLERAALQWCPQPGERVQVVFSGSKRDGKLATVQALKEKEQDGLQMAVLQVDGESKSWSEAVLSWLQPA